VAIGFFRIFDCKTEVISFGEAGSRPMDIKPQILEEAVEVFRLGDIILPEEEPFIDSRGEPICFWYLVNFLTIFLLPCAKPLIAQVFLEIDATLSTPFDIIRLFAEESATVNNVDAEVFSHAHRPLFKRDFWRLGYDLLFRRKVLDRFGVLSCR
jgi:hypothetical protein